MEWNPPSNASDSDVQPSLPHDTITNIAGGIYVPCNASNDLLLRADNHTGYRLLRHIIRDPGSNHYDAHTPMGNISLSCNVHRGMVGSGVHGQLEYPGRGHIKANVYLTGEQTVTYVVEM